MEKEYRLHLANSLLALLRETGDTQVNLADACGIRQGLVADHLRQKAYPRMSLLLKYWQFFNTKLDRPLTLFELTGMDIVKRFEKEISSQHLSDHSDKQLVEAFRALCKDDPRRKAISLLLGIDDATS